MAVVDVLEETADEIINLFTHPAPTLNRGELPSLLRKEGIFLLVLQHNSIGTLFLYCIIHHIQQALTKTIIGQLPEHDAV